MNQGCPFPIHWRINVQLLRSCLELRRSFDPAMIYVKLQGDPCLLIAVENLLAPSFPDAAINRRSAVYRITGEVIFQSLSLRGRTETNVSSVLGSHRSIE